MEEKKINKIKKVKSFSIDSTPAKNRKINFNYNTIDVKKNFQTSKNINKNFKSFSFYSQRANTIKSKTIDGNNIRSMNKILGKITNLNNKLDQIKIRKKRNLKLINKDKPKPKIMCKTETKNKYLLFMNDYYKNKLLLKKRKLENALSEEERNDNYNRYLNPTYLNFNKTEINKNKRSKHPKLLEINNIENDFQINNEENNNSSSKIKYNDNSNQFPNFGSNLEIDKKLSHKTSFNSEDFIIPKIIPQKNEKDTIDKKEQDNNLSNSFIIYQDHINYIKKIRENELLDLINRYKKSLLKNQIEEMSHIQRFVFPTELITYLIKMKKELIVDKFRTEYFNKLDRYNLNNVLQLKVVKNKKNATRKFN